MFAQRCVYVRNRSQPSATVRKRPREGHIAVPMVSSPEGVVFGSFKRRVPSFRVAGVALRDIQTCFVTCRKSFFCGRRNTFATFSEDAFAVFVAGAALWTFPSAFCVAGAAL